MKALCSAVFTVSGKAPKPTSGVKQDYREAEIQVTAKSQLGGAAMRVPNQDEVVNAIWRALIQGCDDGTYFDRDGDLLVVNGRLNLPIVAQDLQQRLAEINNKGKPH